MNTTGIIEVTVKLKLNQDLTEEQAEEVVSEMDYNFNHPNIETTEIVADDLIDRFDLGRNMGEI